MEEQKDRNGRPHGVSFTFIPGVSLFLRRWKKGERHGKITWINEVGTGSYYC